MTAAETSSDPRQPRLFEKKRNMGGRATRPVRRPRHAASARYSGSASCPRGAGRASGPSGASSSNPATRTPSSRTGRGGA